MKPYFFVYTVYVLFSPEFQKHYTGFTSDLEARMLSHNSLGRGWTARFRPWELIFTKTFETKPEAMSFEKWLKTGAGRDYINSIKS
jgi:putative endonuclease